MTLGSNSLLNWPIHFVTYLLIFWYQEVYSHLDAGPISNDGPHSTGCHVFSWSMFMKK